MPKHPETLSCTVQQILFSPKGHIEGFLALQSRKRVQFRVPPHVGQQLMAVLGKKVQVTAHPDDSPKAKKAQHPVYEFERFVDKDGSEPGSKAPARSGPATVKGKVAHIHFAKHGEANGVILESGEFIHLRPHGFAAARLKTGSRVEAAGEMRTTVTGTPLLEAARVNDIEIE